MNTREKLFWTLLGVALFFGIAAVSTDTSFFKNASLTGWLSLSGETNRLTVAGGALELDGSPIGGGDTIWDNTDGVIAPASGQDTNVLRFTSGLADNPTNAAAQVGSAVAWSGGDLMRFRNASTNVSGVTPWGGLWRGNKDYIEALIGLMIPDFDWISQASLDIDGTSGRQIILNSLSDTNFTSQSEAKLSSFSDSVSSGNATLQLTGYGNGFDVWTLTADNDHESFFTFNSSMSLRPGLSESSTSTAYVFGTDNVMTNSAARIAGFRNGNSTDQVSVGIDGRIITQAGAAITPSAANATGNAGTILWDADFIYICVAANTWKRVAIATWP